MECLILSFLCSHQTTGHKNNEAQFFAQLQKREILMAEVGSGNTIQTHEKLPQPCQ